MRFKRTVLLACLLFYSPLVYAANAQNLPPINLVRNSFNQGAVLPENLLPGLPIENGSFSMAEAVAMGLQHNLDIKVAQAETDIRLSELHGAKALRWPTFSVGALTFLKGGNNQTLMTPDMMMNTVDKTIFQDLNATTHLPLFTGGAIRGKIQATHFSLGGAQAALDETSVETAYEIKKLYLKALYLQSEVSVQQDHINVEEELLKNTKARYQVGSGLKADVLRVETELADARRILNDTDVNRDNALFDLKEAMGIDLASNITLADTLGFKPWGNGDLKALIQKSLLRHPSIRKAQQQVKEARAQVRIAKSEYLPQIYGQVTGNLRFPDRPPMMGNGVIGMVTASLPIFNKTRGADLEHAKAVLKKRKQEYLLLQLNITKKVVENWNELHYANENVALAQSAVNQAKEDLRLIEKRYDVGKAVMVEVHDAAWALRQAQLNLAQAVYSHELVKARLIRSLGKING